MNAHAITTPAVQPKANVVVCVLAALTFWLVPETKGVSLEQIERNLLRGARLREIGR